MESYTMFWRTVGGLSADDDSLTAAEAARARAIATEMEFKIVRNRYSAGLSKKRYYQKHLNDVADDRGDSALVHPLLYQYALQSSK